MSIESTRAVMTKYLASEHADVSMMADDVVFLNMATGQDSIGLAGVLETLNYFYYVAFDATAETTTMLFTEDHALFEGYFVGRHIAEFAGIPATNAMVRVPLCVVYDLENDQIKRARIYFELPVLFAQLGAASDVAAAQSA